MRLGIGAKLAYGATDFGFSMAGTIIMLFLLVFAVEVVGIRPGLAGAVIAVGKIWDAIIDPLIGHFSDRTRTRWGRRRPFFLWFAVPYGLSFAAIWSLPSLENQYLLAAVVGLLNLLFITFFSLLMVPYNALGPEMARDYDERTSLTSYRMAFSILGGLVASALPAVLIGSFPDPHRGYAAMGMVFGLAAMVFPFFAFLGTREEQKGGEEEGGSFREGLAAAVGNRPFRLALFAYLANWVALDVIAAVFFFYTQYCLGIGLGASGPLFFVIFCVAALFLPVWVGLSARLEKRTAYLLGLGYLAAVLVVFAFPLPNRPVLLYFLACLAGIGVAAAHVIPLAILPDAIDRDELVTGRNHEGVYFGVVTFLQQLASGGGIALVGLFLEIFGFVRGATTQTARAQLGIRLALGVLPGIILLFGLAAMLLYPITRSEHRRIVAALAARRAAAADAGVSR
ncbi:MAG: MFS transporter [Firmicutes bacterium]|nr:MFS transporter [Bacillota bacterium]